MPVPAKTLDTFRRELHANPELSGREHATHDRIAAFLREHAPNAQLHEHLGGTGLAAVINPAAERTIVYRADCDALPIHEQSNKPHASTNHGVMHACGHDGHTTIACALAARVADRPIDDTTLVVLFQPAEETGEGARAVLNDPRSHELIPQSDQTTILAIHNLPGDQLGRVRVKPGPLCPASVGIRVELTGTTGHASAPHLARSPLPAAAALSHELTALPKSCEIVGALVTPTAILSGNDHEFGVTPATATLCATLRAQRNEDLDTLLARTTTLTDTYAADRELRATATTHDRFPATINDTALAQRAAAELAELGIDHDVTDDPMPWSEDFGHYAQRAPSLMLTIGSGEHTPPLHADTYDFPNELIHTAADAIEKLIRALSALPDPA